MKDLILRNFDEITRSIKRACINSNRNPEEVTVLAVSKKQAVEKLLAYKEICSERGTVPVFGENFVQEFEKKSEQLGSGQRVHLIGALQSNKAAKAAKLFDVIESVHSIKIASALNKEAAKLDKILSVLLQVNISNDPAKSGFSAEECKSFLAEEAASMNALKISGLMAITEFYEVPEDARADFLKLNKLHNSLRSEIGSEMREYFTELSMGMSRDYQIAIEEGATIVRLGTALFGERGYAV